MRRVAAMPSMPGMRTSIRTTSGRSRRASVDGLEAVRGLADDLEVRLRRRGSSGSRRGPARWSSATRTPDHRAAPGPAAGGRGPRTRRRSGCRPRGSPPNSSTRSRMPIRPWPPRASPPPVARPVVGDLDDRRVGLVARQRRAACAPGGVLERVGQRLLHDAVGGQVDAGRQRCAARRHGRGRPRAPAARACSTRPAISVERSAAAPAASLVVGAQDAEQPAHLVEAVGRSPARSCRTPRGPGPGRCRCTRAAADRLQRHHAHAVRDDVVQLAGDPGPLLGRNGPHLGGSQVPLGPHRLRARAMTAHHPTRRHARSRRRSAW